MISVFYPSLDLIKEKSRPEYWVPDEQSPNCAICNLLFGDVNQLNHQIQSLTIKSLSNQQSSSPTSSNSSAVNSLTLPIDFKRHHCRQCGRAICQSCSPNQLTVPEKGWTWNVRVCNDCYDERKSKKE